MKKIIQKITIEDIFGLLLMLVSIIPGLILRGLCNDIWIVSERKDEARDNGFWFFKYIATQDRKKRIYYAIDNDSPDFSKVNQVGNTIKFGGLKHHIYTWAATKYISSQYSNGMPSRIMFYLWLWKINPVKFCFLQHGVTQNKSYYLRQPAKRTDLFCCVGEAERNFMISLGYRKNSAIITGFCRYDALEKKRNKKNQILIMMTWRKYLVGLTEEEFCKSKYYISIMNMINDPLLLRLFPNTKIIFYLHPGMRKYFHLFSSKLNNVIILDEFTENFNDLICESLAFITDYSSVAFDFAYLDKLVSYYQFDDDEFRQKHLQKGYFDYKADGFGPVFTSYKKIFKYISENNYKQEEFYAKRVGHFFKYHDNLNCIRVSTAVKKI
ncbi:hypothetical protein FIU78_00655 [Lactobacillus buchneri]|uniref:CDP-glycerol glycerophosphotransferase family protein n=1 Tax=Lentilactobacillus buchneri TaxID=1581 RepID=UPI001291A0AC|nr:CDP-glycerol glycerophosphotransferase family protein [Lentilactobacillus buchneri]MQM86612.1 hypothetical protein [Lentilactobacillus buchneri]